MEGNLKSVCIKFKKLVVLKLETSLNLRFLCWNCTVECGRGYLRRRIHIFDHDVMLNDAT